MCREAGFSRISADLLLGIPGQFLSGVLNDAKCLIKAGIEHLSIYLLDIDKDCPLKARLDSGSCELPEDGLVADTYLALLDQLSNLGFSQYEISNCSKTGRHSIHNVRYWRRRPYLGCGPSAASNIGNLRWTQAESLEEWLDGAIEPEFQLLADEEALAEIPLLGLRMRDGVDWRFLSELAGNLGLCGMVHNWEAKLGPFLERGLLIREGDKIRLTREGMLVGNQIFSIFL
jgi:oxygen-independent coproporphyrinogen-3 oxidase